MTMDVLVPRNLQELEMKAARPAVAFPSCTRSIAKTAGCSLAPGDLRAHHPRAVHSIPELAGLGMCQRQLMREGDA